MAKAQWEDGVNGLRLIGPFSRIGLLWAVPTFALDQLSKWWVLNVVKLELDHTQPISAFFDLHRALNKGVSYSLLTSNSQEPLIALSIVLSLFLVVWLSRAKTSVAACGLGLILGGALGNVLDRVIYGGVVDFVQLHWGNWYWYIFNIADVGIVAGVALLIYDNLFGGENA
jgi:signal peptidase II